MKSENIPPIRFPEYTDEWRNHKLGDLYSERNEKGNDELQILSVSIHSGVSDGELDEEDLGKVVRRSEDKSKYKRVYEGDLIFNMMRAWQGAIGVAKSDGMISPAYISAIPNEEDVFPLFMDYALRRKQAIEEINRLSYGVTDFRKRLYWNSFVRVNCMLPSTEEQQKIYCFLKKIDNLIILLERKCDKLREYKRGCLQKMFPRDDSDVPEIRFPGFTDAWEQRKLSEICDFEKGRGLSRDDLTADGIHPCILYGQLFTDYGMFIDKVKSYTDASIGDVKLSEMGDILIPRCSTAPEGIGRASVLLLADVILGFDINILKIRDKNKYVPEYISLAINHHQKDLQSKVVGTMVRHLENKEIKDVSIEIPCSKEEQKQIYHVFSNLDTLITLHQRKCDKYKELKNSLLQQMFV